MANSNHHHNHHQNHQQNHPEGLTDDFFEQILAIPSYPGNHHHQHQRHDSSGLTTNVGNLAGTPPPPSSSMLLQLNSGNSNIYHQQQQQQGNLFPLGLGLEQSLGKTSSTSFMKLNEESSTTSGMGHASSSSNDNRGGGLGNSAHMSNLFPSAFGGHHVQQQQQQRHSVRPTLQSHQVHQQPFHGQPTPGAAGTVQHPPAIRPRVRARRGQATDPHSIAERLRRERIAERMKALQELVPSSNKTDRAAMLDEIVDYVKFLRLQVKVLSMSRLGGAGAVAQLVADTPLSSVEGEASDGGSNRQAWEKWSTDGTEHQVAKLIEEDVGAAMQFLQSKALCIMPISLASAIYHTQTDNSSAIKPEPNAQNQ
ncbi:hypothetical protein C5167_043946 [Papaver somniferum]|uniref:BHLH domain-containing protein n=1 Tax=Papaver somniferum TaxID=3469 RepID=A0A4Y7LB00_PAPSO|nr:transcription factor UNE12-like [Papaver somniferum]RZC81365.1 hypothetical protein C5167_043946 [Papaver somniferum]